MSELNWKLAECKYKDGFSMHSNEQICNKGKVELSSEHLKAGLNVKKKTQRNDTSQVCLGKSLHLV